MEEVDAYLGLGSNMGDRRGNLDLAIAGLDALEGCRVEAVSAIVGSAPQGRWDGTPCGDFLNCCVRVRTTLAPLELLRAIKDIERSLGRDIPDESEPQPTGAPRVYRDRPIDIDILLYGDRRIDTAQLQIPHPRMREREWVMGPLGGIMK